MWREREGERERETSLGNHAQNQHEHDAAASLHSTGLPSSSCVSNFRPKSICVSVFCPHFVAKYRPAIVYLYLCFKFQAIVYLCFSFLPTLCRLAKLSYWVLARARRDPLASAAAFISVYSFLLVKLSNFQICSRPWPSHACPPRSEQHAWGAP